MMAIWPSFVVTAFVVAILLLSAGQTRATAYMSLVGTNVTIPRPTQPSRYTEYYLYRHNVQQSTGTTKLILNSSLLVITNTTFEDADVYEWRSQRHGQSSSRYRSTVTFYLDVSDYIQASDVYRTDASLNKTLMCECRYNGSSSTSHVQGFLGDRVLSHSSYQKTHHDSIYTTKAYFHVSRALGKSFRCEVGSSSSKIVSENITVGIFHHLLYPGATFNISANISDDRLLGIDAQDIPLLAGNLPEFLIPSRKSDHYHVTSQEQGNFSLVELSVNNMTFADAGVYRWYFFGQGTFGLINVVVAETPQLIVPDRMVAGEAVQLKCRFRYYEGNSRTAAKSRLLMSSFIDDEALSMFEESRNQTSNFREITQIYELNLCADHHLQNVMCRIQLDDNPYEVMESSVELRVYYPPMWAEVSPLPLGVEYLVNTSLECQADANPPPEYFWTNTKTSERVNGSRLLLDSSFLEEKESRWMCRATNTFDGVQFNVFAQILFRLVANQYVTLPGSRLVPAGHITTVSADVRMMEQDLLAIESNDQVLVALGGPYNGSFRHDKYVLTRDGSSVTLMIHDTALNDSGSYRWSIFGTAAVVRTNIIVAEPPNCLTPDGLTAGNVVNLTCRVRFGIGSRPAIREDEYPQMLGLLAGRPLVAHSITTEETNNTALLTAVFRETVHLEWHAQGFSCRLTLPGAADEHLQNEVTLSITGETPLNECLTRHRRSQHLKQQRRRRVGAF